MGVSNKHRRGSGRGHGHGRRRRQGRRNRWSVVTSAKKQDIYILTMKE